jgi:hypothetical protein
MTALPRREVVDIVHALSTEQVTALLGNELSSAPGLGEVLAAVPAFTFLAWRVSVQARVFDVVEDLAVRLLVGHALLLDVRLGLADPLVGEEIDLVTVFLARLVRFVLGLGFAVAGGDGCCFRGHSWHWVFWAVDVVSHIGDVLL